MRGIIRQEAPAIAVGEDRTQSPGGQLCLDWKMERETGKDRAGAPAVGLSSLMRGTPLLTEEK